MTDISIPKPIHHDWPMRPVKPTGHTGDKRSPPRRKPKEKLNTANDNEDDATHIDEYA